MSNLLEKASILLTPTAYDDGKILSVKPEDGTGDFDFTRNSSATRVNSQGLIEDVQILSSNLVSNGDFSQEGAEEITNGDFTTDSDWLLGTGWSIGGGEAVALNSPSGQRLRQDNILEVGKVYKLTYEVKSISSGGFRAFVGAVSGTAVYSIGTYTEYITTISDDFFIRTLGTTSGSIDNVSVKEVGQDWILGTGWSIGEDKAISDATQGYISQNNVGAAGVTATYKVQWTQNITAGARLRFFARNYNDSGNATVLSLTRDDGVVVGGGNCVGSGTFTGYISSTNGYSFKILAETGVEADITNISTIEITDDTNLPRIDYTGGEGHWLFEPQSTNLVYNSNDGFASANMNLVYNNAISPDGTQNAYKSTTTTASGAHVRTSNLAFAATSTFSVFLKYGNNQWYQIMSAGKTGNFVNVDIQNGVFGTNGADTENLSIKDFGNGWYRISGTFINAAATSTLRIYTGSSSSSNWAATSAPIGSYNYGYGFQVEASSFATSYIPTNGSTVTRLQDAAFGAGSSDLINSTEGVLYAEIATLQAAAGTQVLGLSDGSGSNRISFQTGTAANQLRFVVDSGGNQASYWHVLSDITNFNKVALKWKQDDFSFWVNGVKVATDISGNVPAQNILNTLDFYYASGSGIYNFFGKTKCLAVWKEALTDAELTCLTTI